MKKKVWEKPRLIVLFRGRPEESILDKCRISGEVGPYISGCQATSGAPCESIAGS